MKRKNIRTKLLVLGLIMVTTSCKKFILVDPPVTSINQANIYNSDATAIQITTGFYAALSNENIVNTTYLDRPGALFFNSSLSSDELVLHSQDDIGSVHYYTNAIQSTDANLWSSFYANIFKANAAIEGLEASTTLTAATKQQLLGEAKFFRAFNYFYLINFFGDVPLVLGTDPEINRLLPRISKEFVYKQIISDLKDAQNQMADDYLDAKMKTTTERTRPNRWVAKALLARVYLYNADYSNAEILASEVIGNSRYELISSLENVFLKNSRETIWSLQPVQSSSSTGYNTGDSKLFILPASGPNTMNPVYLSKHVIDNFEQGDMRKDKWTNNVVVSGTTYNYAYKYRAPITQTSVTEYEIVLRIAEQYLIRAEARARQNKTVQAIEDLNVLRNRARAAVTVIVPNPLPAIASNISQQNLFPLIERERFSELFTEWGHRWLDLKRMPGFNNPNSSRADEVMPAITLEKNGIWNSNWKLYPIPFEDINRNPNMTGHQNPGYGQ